jgi:hypothetical protein
MKGMQAVKEINSIKHEVAKIFNFYQLVESPLSCTGPPPPPPKKKDCSIRNQFMLRRPLRNDSFVQIYRNFLDSLKNRIVNKSAIPALTSYLLVNYGVYVIF